MGVDARAGSTGTRQNLWAVLVLGVLGAVALAVMAPVALSWGQTWIQVSLATGAAIAIGTATAVLADRANAQGAAKTRESADLAV